MAIKVLIFFLLIFSLLLFPVLAENPDFFMEMRFIQRLTWSGDEYAMRYEVIIERETNGVYRIVTQEFTTEFFLEVSLSPGIYRYQVFPYDYLEQRGTGSGWIGFEVYAALDPVLSVSVPELDVTERDGYITVNRFILNIYGENIDTDAEIILRRIDGAVFIPDEAEISPDGSNARLLFNDPYSLPEKFEIIVRNPGGLETSMLGTTDIPPPPPPPVKYFDFYIGAALMPKMSLYGDMNWLALQSMVFPGAALRFGMLYRLFDFAKIGLEVAAGWHSYDNDLQSVTADLCLLAQKHIPNGMDQTRFAFSFRLGAGYSFLIGDAQDQDWQPFHINTGFSVLWLPLRFLYLEIGLDLLFWIKEEDVSSCFRPFIGVGFKF